MGGKLKVMLTTEGTYPFHQGGVSTWCDELVHKLDSIEFVVYSVLTDPFITQKFKLPLQTKLIKMPLWGTEEPGEHLDTPFSQVYTSKVMTTSTAIDEYFIPLFTKLIKEFIQLEKNPNQLAEVLVQLHQYFKKYEYKVSFKSELTWEIYKQIIMEATSRNNDISQPNVFDLIQSLGWIYRFLNIVNTPIPKVHIAHSSAAAFCGIPAVLSKLIDGSSFLLTEHGVYLREQYLSLSNRKYSPFLNTFLVRMVHSITSLNYTFADQISPVCEYNSRWEKKLGVDPKKIQVIYNGVDQKIFSDSGRQKHDSAKRPTVVSIARIDPIKDIKTLMRAAAVVKENISNVKFLVYGSVSVQTYYEECLELKTELELDDTFFFEGHTSKVTEAYQKGDIVALTSISEAFPYSVVEAMMMGKAVISTDVGGVGEALGDTGLLVTTRDYMQLSDGIIKLLSEPEWRMTLGKEAQERALNNFTLNNMLSNHFKSYIKLAVKANDDVSGKPKYVNVQLRNQQLQIEKGRVLYGHGYYEESIQQYQLAIKQSPSSSYIPVLLLEKARAYHKLGKYELAKNEIDKVKILDIMNGRSA